MNLLLFSEVDRIGDNRIVITDRRLRHLRQVLGSATGDRLRVGELGGLMGIGEIVEIGDRRAVIAIGLDQQPPGKLPLSLVLALPRPKMLRRILRTVAELGVGQLHLINSYRVEKSYWQTPVLAEAALRDYLVQGLEQARDTVLPRIHCQRRFKPFVEDTLPGLVGDSTALLAHPGPYPPCPGSLAGDTVLVIGPEGGFIPYEVAKLEEAGCRPVSLGPRILRVENALTSLLGRLFH
jgi:RsmE family RNA methyltransferase